MRGSLPTLIAMMALLLPMVASAQVYKWIDSHGTTHFSQSPPPQGTKYVLLHTAASVDQPPPPPPRNANGAQDSSGNDQAQAGKGQSPQLKRFCAQLQSNITLLQSHQSLQRMTSDGKTHPVDDRLRAQQLKQQQLRYNAYCHHK